MSLIIADAVVIAAPPIRAPRNEGLSAQPPTIVVGVVIGTVDPDPGPVPKYPMPVMEAVKVVVVVALRKALVFEPVAVVMPLRESAAITMLVTMNAAFREPRSAHSRASQFTVTHSGPRATAVTARHCAGMATTATMITATMTAAMHSAATST